MKVPDCTGVLNIAITLLEEAEKSNNLTTAHARRNRAAAVALVSIFPLRSADLTLSFGRNITWNEGSYHLYIPATSKTGAPYSASIHPIFGRFIDKLVLAGQPEALLDHARTICMQEERALYINRWGETCHAAYASHCWYHVFGVGSHVARAKIHDEFARLGPYGVDMALAACGHKSERSAEFYRSKAFNRTSSEYVLKRLADEISESEWDEHFK